MIRTKLDLRLYIEIDATAMGVDPKRHYIGKEIWKFLKSLRHYEYCLNSDSSKIARFLRYLAYRHWSLKLGFVIPPNTFGGKD